MEAIALGSNYYTNETPFVTNIYIDIRGTWVAFESFVRISGVVLDPRLSWKDNIGQVCKLDLKIQHISLTQAFHTSMVWRGTSTSPLTDASSDGTQHQPAMLILQPTCYANSLIQPLPHTPFLSTALVYRLVLLGVKWRPLTFEAPAKRLWGDLSISRSPTYGNRSSLIFIVPTPSRNKKQPLHQHFFAAD